MTRATIGTVLLVAMGFFSSGAWAADLLAIADANTDTAAPNANFGGNGIIAVSSARVALVRFNAAQVTQSTGGTATLKLKVLLAKNSNNAVSIRLVTSAWNESTVTARTLPAIAATTLDQKTLTLADQGKVVSFNVSAALAAWRSDPATNFGLAIVAGTPGPNLQLGSREAGGAAVLGIVGPPADNDVTVSLSGGDYPDPVVAAKNALAGDTWCASPQLAKPCVIHVAAGLYALKETIELPAGVSLVGEGKADTLLISSDTGLTIQHSLVSDLTLVSPSTAVSSRESNGMGMRLERVSLRGGITGVGFGSGPGGIIIDSEIAAVGDGSEIVALDFDGGSGPLTLLRSRVTAVAAQGIAEAVYVTEGSTSTEINFQDSSLSVWGKIGASGFVSGDEFASLMTMTRVNIDVTSPGGALGLSAFTGTGGNLLDVHISARGGPQGNGGTGVSWRGYGLVLDGVTIDAGGAALSVDYSILHAMPPLSATVLRSQLISSDGPAVLSTKSGVRVESSILRGGPGAILEDGANLAVFDSQFAGAVEFAGDTGSTATCDHVFGENLALRPANCGSQ